MRYIIVKAVSECKTYKETFKCLSHAEADALIKALVAEGWVATKKESA